MTKFESILYFGKPLQPYWRRNGDGACRTISKSRRRLLRAWSTAMRPVRCRTSSPTHGASAATVTPISLPSPIGRPGPACGIAADSHKQPLLFTKENTSNGDIATVDVIFPMDPIWVLLSPTLAKASLVSELDVRRQPALEISQRPARSGHLSRCRRPRRRRRRHARRRERQHDHSLRRNRAGRRLRRLAPALVAAAHPVGPLSRKIRARSRRPALHRRFHGPSGPQRQPVDQGDPWLGRVW